MWRTAAFMPHQRETSPDQMNFRKCQVNAKRSGINAAIRAFGTLTRDSVLECGSPLPLSRTRELRAVNSRGGFTMIELMVVVVLIAIMAAAIVPQMKGTFDDALLRS